ncbi:MAG TPA: hypothetical protein VIW01_06880 [Dehalococcoidia bacterium]
MTDEDLQTLVNAAHNVLREADGALRAAETAVQRATEARAAARLAHDNILALVKRHTDAPNLFAQLQEAGSAVSMRECAEGKSLHPHADKVAEVATMLAQYPHDFAAGILAHLVAANEQDAAKAAERMRTLKRAARSRR